MADSEVDTARKKAHSTIGQAIAEGKKSVIVHAVYNIKNFY